MIIKPNKYTRRQHETGPSFDVLSLGESKKWGSNENKEMTLPLMKFG
jgi:hypothetical protein